MKRLGLHIISILIITIVAMVLLDYTYTKAFQNDTPRNKVQLAALLESTHINYIFLGSSRVENHIDCDLIKDITGKSCLNLGIQGSNIKDAKGIALLLKANNITYDKLLVQVDYIYNFHNYSPSFIATTLPFIEKDNFPSNFKKDLDLPKMYKVPFIKYAYNDKISGIREIILQYMRKKPNLDLNNGFKPLQGIGKKVSGEFPNKIVTRNRGLDELIASNENVVLFTAPYCKNTKNRDTFMNDLELKYPNLKSFITIFDEEEQYFQNCGHLNENGARNFTEIITKDILLK